MDIFFFFENKLRFRFYLPDDFCHNSSKFMNLFVHNQHFNLDCVDKKYSPLMDSKMRTAHLLTCITWWGGRVCPTPPWMQTSSRRQNPIPVNRMTHVLKHYLAPNFVCGREKWKCSQYLDLNPTCAIRTPTSIRVHTTYQSKPSGLVLVILCQLFVIVHEKTIPRKLIKRLRGSNIA